MLKLCVTAPGRMRTASAMLAGSSSWRGQPPYLDFARGSGEDRIEYESRTAARDLAAVSASASRGAPDATLDDTTAPERPRQRPPGVAVDRLRPLAGLRRGLAAEEGR